MQRHLVYNSHEDLPKTIKEALTEYYEGTSHRPINNDTYSRYPYLFDFDGDGEPLTSLDLWFLNNGATVEDCYVIIHWDW